MKNCPLMVTKFLQTVYLNDLTTCAGKTCHARCDAFVAESPTTWYARRQATVTEILDPEKHFSVKLPVFKFLQFTITGFILYIDSTNVIVRFLLAKLWLFKYQRRID
ncbi:hypothetical protein WN48_02162 [Eufriesea mexicana]|uniref:Uncharacterized protein n=1 Tax=Eufriesea mexicana TaxID=516756 RepID=A0A310SKR4_9HYME|nr:hypothetical protein WN48_02162 [Eufriesea mexicana]